jgi:predicted porin
MKKSLFAAAALTAMAGAAQAQSSVTVYGLLDMGYIGSNAREVNASPLVAGQATTSQPGGPGAVNKTQKSAFGNGAEQTSRLGFKGNEDLGGGMSAFFTVELGLTPQNGNLSGGDPKDSIQNTTQASGSAIDNRQSFVGLKKNGLGQFAFGRQYTGIFNAAAATDPGQLNNVAGNVIYNSGSVYASASTTGSGTNNNVGFTNRASNALTFKTDQFSGLSANGMYALNNQNQTQIGTYSAVSGTSPAIGTSGSNGGNTNWNGWGLGVDYTWQKLFLSANYQSFKTVYTSLDSGTTASTTNINGASATGGQVLVVGPAFAPSNITDKQTYVGGTYDFGILKAYLQWSGRKVQNDTQVGSSTAIGGYSVVSGQQLNRTAQQLGVRSYITPVIEAWGSIGNGKYTGPIGSGTASATSGLPGSVSFVGWQLGSNYYLSKRTNVYAIYGQQQTSSSTAGVYGSGNSANQYALGLRHTF